MLQQEQPDDYVIATGKSYSLEDFVRFAFEYFHLDWQKYVQTDSSLFLPTDLAMGRANPQKAWHKLEWKAKKITPDVVKMMISARIP
jgi:GDPmannose 4,6-dehydratase